MPTCFDSMAQVGDFQTARMIYDLALDVEPVPEVAALAASYTAEGKSEQAVQVWRRVAGMTTIDQPTHWLALGEAARLEGNWSAARQSFERAIAVSTDPYGLYLRLGRVLAQLKDWPEAVAVYKKAIELRPRASSEPYIAAGDIKLQQGVLSGSRVVAPSGNRGDTPEIHRLISKQDMQRFS
jgi:uncharacterized protein HemY